MPKNTKSLDSRAGRAWRVKQEIDIDISDCADMTYRKNGMFSALKKGQCAPRFVSFCSMYGNVLSYPLEDAGFIMRGDSARRAPCSRVQKLETGN